MDNFALADDHMFLNTLIHRIAKEKEVRFFTIDGTISEGFITGLDEEWIQITTTQNQTLVLINIMNITKIEETGESIKSIIIDKDPEKNEIAKEAIRNYCLTIYVKAKKIFQEKQEAKARASREYRDSKVDREDIDGVSHSIVA